MRMFAAVLLLSIAAVAQSSAQAPPATTQPAQTGSASAPAKAAPTTPDRSNQQTTVPADIKEVRRNLEALKTAVAKMDEGASHDMAEQNVKFLESLVSYLEHESAAKPGATTKSKRATTSDSTKGLAGENPK